MSRGDKSAYTAKQQRKARHIEEGYIERGLARDEAAARAWATVNKQDGGGSGRGQPAKKKAAARRDSARRAAVTRSGH
jgi:plasmid stabilization system protein ParE